MDGDKVLAPGNRNHWVKIIERSTQDLHDRVNMQRTVLLTVLGKVREPPSHDLCPVADCPHRIRLRKVLLETIEELEETKKSFKSKRLEELRKRLMNVVKETD